mmetsp:Transcript_924/g.1812  ORF Transcript_924/g.1812 Transcript_924/m.1812 type:complete len:205 (-) Transcript_924:2454-3068(-)
MHGSKRCRESRGKQWIWTPFWRTWTWFVKQHLTSLRVSRAGRRTSVALLTCTRERITCWNYPLRWILRAIFLRSLRLLGLVASNAIHLFFRLHYLYPMRLVVTTSCRRPSLSSRMFCSMPTITEREFAPQLILSLQKRNNTAQCRDPLTLQIGRSLTNWLQRPTKPQKKVRALKSGCYQSLPTLLLLIITCTPFAEVMPMAMGC